MSYQRNLDSTGAVTFSTTKTVANIDLTDASAEVHDMTVINSSASTSIVGLGYQHVQPKVYNYDGSAVTDITDDIIAGSATLGTGGKFIVAVPSKFHSINFTIGTTGGALSNRRYYNGSITALSPTLIETLTFASTGNSADTFLPPSDIEPLPADHALVTAGIDPGMYIYQVDIASVAVVTAISVLHFNKVIETVAAGATVSDSGIKKLPKGCKPAAFVSTANADNSLSVSFSRV